jgi:hypothetical protein
MFSSIACHPIQQSQSRFCARRKSLRWEIHIPVTLSSTISLRNDLQSIDWRFRNSCHVRHGEEILLVFVLTGAGRVVIRLGGALDKSAIREGRIFSGPRRGETDSRSYLD